MGRNKIEVEIVADALGYQRGLRQASSETENFGSKLGGVAKTGALAFAGGVVVAAAALGESVKAAIGAQTAQASLDAALKATHQSVAEMTPALEEAAASGRKLGFSDVDTAHALTKLEIATGNTKKAIADLSVAQDIARVKHIDLATASQTLAQAMTGSQRAAKQLGIIVPAVTSHLDALKASHVDLKTESGRLLEAHAKLLDKMSTGNAVIDATKEKVKGQAQAYADTAQGAMAQFHAQVESLQVTLGTALLPAVTKVTAALADGVAWLQQSKGAHEAVAEAGRGLAVVFRLIGEAIDWVKGHWAEITADATKAMGTLQSVVEGAVTVILALWNTFGGTLTSALQGSVQNIIEILTGAFNVVEGLFRLVGDLIHGRWAKVWQDVEQIVTGAWQIVEGVFRQALNTLVTIATLIGTGILKAVEAGLTGLANLMGRLVNAGVDAVRNLIGAAGSAAASIGSAIFNGIVHFVEQLPGKVGGLLERVIGLLKSLPGRAVAAVGDLGGVLFNAGVQLIQGFINGIKSMLGAVASTLGGIASSAVSWKGPPEYDSVVLVDNGRRMMQGFQSGIRDELGNVAGLLGSVAPLALSVVGGSVSSFAAPQASPSAPGFATSSADGGGGSTVNVTVNGFVGNDQEIALRIRNALKLHGYRNVEVGLT